MKTDRDKSIFQKDSEAYYDCVRKIHSDIFCSDKRRDSELASKRYTCDNKKIKNLFSLIDFLRKALPTNKPVKGVDLGCGSHYFVDYSVNNFGWDVYGYDVDEFAISLAKDYYPEHSHRYIQHDLVLNGIPLDNGDIDFVFCNAMIQHLSKSECLELFREANRVLSNNGILFVIFKKTSTKDIGSDKRDISQIKFIDPEVVKEINSKQDVIVKNNYLESIPNISLYSLNDIIKMSNDAGFSTTSSVGDYFFEYLSGKGFLTGAVMVRKRETMTMSEVDCNKLIERNRDIAQKEFSRFKFQNGLPDEAKIEDVACQRLLKTMNTKEGKRFKKYHGLSIVIPLPEETFNAVSNIAKKIESKLDEIGLGDQFIFVPKDTYHVTVMGIAERPNLSVSEPEIKCYSRIIDKANNSLTKSTSISISIDKAQYYDDFLLYLKVQLDREPLNTIAVLNQELGNNSLYTGSYHITLAYQLTSLSQNERVKIADVVRSLPDEQVRLVGAFQVNQAQLSVFESMSNYRAITDTVLELS